MYKVDVMPDFEDDYDAYMEWLIPQIEELGFEEVGANYGVDMAFQTEDNIAGVGDVTVRFVFPFDGDATEMGVVVEFSVDTHLSKENEKMINNTQVWYDFQIQDNDGKTVDVDYNALTGYIFDSETGVNEYVDIMFEEYDRAVKPIQEFVSMLKGIDNAN